ncbi:GmrSD restriction endonuclease domain-containing protein [Chamaesiphon minutus]|uniref:HNH nuclease domain-containing protein n=1 Tax=Chamaesiphon minutus (strain ATCC 27169 / PCC 6605) TaxID=1173020 RepID=K9UC14_CHAP6|nr:DUF262 domain-containing protein [Chamaesiphon minutus]AFY92355.1 Protein of unknown function DUF262 [Chamaesiphon minutus PCC 6605]
MPKVNLDALIPREDFELQDNVNSGKKKETISIEDLKPDSFFFSYIRKPDFQRETNEWDDQKICNFIESFIEGDLIPAIILWRSTGGYLFVIDGSHRMSTLSAWVNDDYGDGDISKKFYDGVISEDQSLIANKTRNLVNKKIGSYNSFKTALTRPDDVKPEVVKYAKNLAALAIQLQWVEGDASKAENSFFKINQQAAPINPIELKLLQSRKKPNSIAARAIIRSGKGHKYWSCFSDKMQQEIQEIAQEINHILFEPKLHTPIKTLDIPIGGKLSSAQALSLILDFVNIANNIDFDKNIIDDDGTGEKTIFFLKNTRKIVYRLNSNKPSSLGLHPIVYCYSRDGRYRNVSFFAVVDFVMELEKRKKINEFIDVREEFENLLLSNDYLIKQIYEKYRDVQKSYKFVSYFFQEVIVHLKNGKSERDTVKEIASTDKFKYLNIRESTTQSDSQFKDFDKNQKSEIFLNEALQNPPKCKICNGLMHKNSISIDHIQRKADGGFATLDNGQITHPYCNTTYKN